MDASIKKEIFERKKVKKKMSKAQIQEALIKKKQCDVEALTIVEQLLEPTIDHQWLLCNLKYINKSHMEDVIEERAIIKLCGYVLCNKALTTIIDQRYHISTKKNKVYDITRRKNFCSSRCYGACNYLLEQMLTSPLWLRDKEDIPEFKVLPTKDELEKSIPGDEIYVSDINMVLNDENKQEQMKSNFACNNSTSATLTACLQVDTIDENIQADNEKIKMTDVIKEINDSKKPFFTNSNEDFKNVNVLNKNSKNRNASLSELICDNYEDLFTLEQQISLCDVANDNKGLDSDTDSSKNNISETIEQKENIGLADILQIQDTPTFETSTASDSALDSVHETQKNKSKKHKGKNSSKVKQSNEFYNLAINIEHSVREWISEDTICLLSGEEECKNRLLENIVLHDRYLHLCKKLNKLQLEDEKNDHIDTSTLKPLPHLSVLKEEGEKMELKVRAFYKGSVVIENPENASKDAIQDNDFTPVFPLTDAHAPKALRRRIFLDKLNRILPDLLRALCSNKLPQYVYNSEKTELIKVLVNTFSLSAANIMFKTAEWTLVGLIIIKMLSMIDPQLKFLLSTKQAKMYISMILMSYKLDSHYLDRLLMELTNSTRIINVDSTDLLI